ncbi:MAG TPA: tetratricopeptide repeat protein [Gemmatimonadaceae bacterium]
MSTANTRAAIRSLDAARPVIARLSSTQDKEDRAADLIEGWSAVETALRSLVGGSTLAGKPLIHELRARQVISFDQANSLADFHSAAERARRTDYVPDENDVEAARQGFARLDAGLVAADSAPAAPMGAGAVPPGAATAAGAAYGTAAPIGAAVPVSDAGTAPGVTVRTRRTRPGWLIPVLAVVALVAIGAALWYAFAPAPGEKAMTEGIGFYRNGQREQAVAAFERAARENPNDARPHVYLARMAREVGNLTLARDEATKAIRADTGYALGYREMGAVMLTSGRPDLAKNFYVRAVERDAQDKVAMGYLACALVRLGQYDQAQRFRQRAGSGEWDRCAQPPATMPAGGYPPGYVPPQGYPQGYPQQVPPGYPPPGYPQPVPQP